MRRTRVLCESVLTYPYVSQYSLTKKIRKDWHPRLTIAENLYTMVYMMNNKGNIMKTILDLGAYAVQMIFVIAAAPFLALGYGFVKLTGGDPMNLDGMGVDFISMVIVAIIAAVAVGSFAIGYFL